MADDVSFFSNVSHLLLKKPEGNGSAPSSSSSASTVAMETSSPVSQNHRNALDMLIDPSMDPSLDASPASSSSSSSEEGSDSDSEDPRKDFLDSVLRNINKDENHLNIGMTIMSRVFLRYHENEAKMEEVCKKYPTAVSKFLKLMFKNALGKEGTTASAAAAAGKETSSSSTTSAETDGSTTIGHNSSAKPSVAGSNNQAFGGRNPPGCSPPPGPGGSPPGPGGSPPPGPGGSPGPGPGGSPPGPGGSSSSSFTTRMSPSELFMTADMNNRREKTIKKIVSTEGLESWEHRVEFQKHSQQRIQEKKERIFEETEAFIAKRARRVPMEEHPMEENTTSMQEDLEDQKLMDKILKT